MTPTAAAVPAGLANAFATWERLPALAAALAARDAVHLVIDPTDARILSASEAAAGLAESLAGPALAGLNRQIAAAVAGDADAQFNLDGNTDNYRATLEAGRQTLIDRAEQLEV